NCQVSCTCGLARATEAAASSATARTGSGSQRNGCMDGPGQGWRKVPDDTANENGSHSPCVPAGIIRITHGTPDRRMKAPFQLRREGPVAHLRLDRPELHNAFDAALVAGL